MPRTVKATLNKSSPRRRPGSSLLIYLVDSLRSPCGPPSGRSTRLALLSGMRRNDESGLVQSILNTCMVAALLLLSLQPARASAPHTADPHYGPAGFFDIHVCNWPGRPLFFMPLFSTPRYAEIQSVEVLTPDGELLIELDLERFRTIKRDKLPDKRVFIQQLDVPADAADGWYSARTRMANGEVFITRDHVILHSMPQAGGQSPAHEEELAEVPEKLVWEPAPGANFYQVFIRDLWNEDQLIHTSKLLTRPELELPPGLLRKGGMYSWVIHARDTNSHILLGDFNHGSLNTPATFLIDE